MNPAITTPSGAAERGLPDVGTPAPQTTREASLERRLLSRAHVVLALVVLVGLGARLWGIGWQLPWLLHGDEHHYVRRGLEMLQTGDLNPDYFLNPSGLTYWLIWQFWLLGQLGAPLGILPLASEIAQHPEYEPFFYLVGRVNSALLGAATVWAVAWLGSMQLGRAAGLVAAAFLALNFLHVRDSHYATNDVPATFLLVLSVCFAARISRNPTFWVYVLAGLVGGLATGTKYSVGFFFVPILVAHVLSWRSRAIVPVALGMLAAAGVAAAAGYLLAVPFTILAYGDFRQDFDLQMDRGESIFFGQPAEPLSLLYALTMLQAMGVVQVLLALLGAAVLAVRSRGAALLLASFVLVYLAFMLRQELFFVRFAVPLVPFLSLFAAVGAVVVAARLAATPRRTAALVVVALVAIAQPALAVVQHNVIIGREDTRVTAARWALDNLAGRARLAAESDALELPPELRNSVAGFNRRQRLHRRATSEWQGRHDFAMLSSSIQDRYRLPATERWSKELEQNARWDLRWPEELERSELFKAEHVPIVSFAPGPGGTSVPYRSYDDYFTPFWNLPAWEHPGPTIWVYALR